MNVKAILEDEAHNRSRIILYQSPTGWRAYEQSAFLFATIFTADKIEVRDNYLFIEVDRQWTLRHSAAPFTFNISHISNDRILIECDCLFSGFAKWRSKTIAELN